MDIEFHYYVTAFLASEAGFSQAQAQTIAYASQYIDENDVPFKVHNRHTGRVYRNFISQTMDILKPKRELMRIYPIFHFMPGEPGAYCARRIDGKQHILNTTPNNENANLLMAQALASDRQIRLYWMGVAAHMYIDTWAHQNFVGWYDEFNQLNLDLKPNIGHADGEHHPDWVSHRWYDERLVEPEVNNRHRFLSAARELFLWFVRAQDATETSAEFQLESAESHWHKIELKLRGMMGPTYTGNKCKYRESRLMSYQQAMPWLVDFDERAWFDEAIDTQVEGLRDTHDGILAKFTLFEDIYAWKEGVLPEQSHWFAFQEAVKAHERAGIRLLESRFTQMGVNLADV